MNQEKLAKLQAQVRIGGKVRKLRELYFCDCICGTQSLLMRGQLKAWKKDFFMQCGPEVVFILLLPEKQLYFTSQLLNE